MNAPVDDQRLLTREDRSPSPAAVTGRRSIAGRSIAVLAAVGLAALIVVNRSDLVASGRAVRHAARLWLLVALLLTVLWSAVHASMHAAAQRAAGVDATTAHLWIVSSAGTFLNHVAKSLGVAGLMIFLVDARHRAAPRGRVAAAYLLVVVNGELTFALTLVVAVVVLAVDRHLPRAELVAASVFGGYLVLRLGAIGAALRSREALGQLWQRWQRGRQARSADADGSSMSVADDLYDTVHGLARSGRSLVTTGAHALAIELLGAGILWASLAAVHVHVGPLAVFAAFVASVLFSFVGFVPGGLGLVELSMVRVLTSFGAPKVPAVAAVVIYRLLDLWLPVLVGAFTARHVRRVRPLAMAVGPGDA